ncbi:MAG: hypothetical protein ABF893_11840 [Gluconacetobacter liquefaciens]
MRASVLKMVFVMGIALPILSACADRDRPLDDDGESYAENDGGRSGGRGPGGMGGGQGLWTEALRTATQVGMGFLHH